ncbi:MAG: HigA family addiction module antitoxin [Betaproteobacteria bacterium]|nr:HigA family addiction module antitoxin [Betaproteobacteria bacterium]
MSRMFDPPHPGAFLRNEVLPALGLSVTEAARQLGVSRVMLSRLINGRAGVSAEMALRLEAWLKTPEGGGPSAEMFLRMQASYDLWQAEHSGKPAFVVRPAMAGI